MRKIFLLVGIFLAACGPVTPVATQAATSSPTSESPVSALPTAPMDVLPTPVSGGGYPTAVFLAQEDLATRLNLPIQQITVTGITPVDWPDACLGAAPPDQMCAQVITPGYEIIFTVGAAQYIYHTDADGKSLRMLGKPGAVQGGEKTVPILDWTGPNCERLSVTTSAVFYGQSGSELSSAPGMLDALGSEPLKNWVKSFAPFESDTPAGSLKFTGFDSKLVADGYGKSIASPADQRMIAEWAKLQYAVAQSGRAGAAWGLAFSYRREGGIAGFCDDVAVYLDGRALVSSCKGQNAELFLTASEMQQVYAWFDQFQQIDYQQADPAVADAMKITLSMSGQGDLSADETTVREIVEFASSFTAQVSFAQQAAPDLAGAEVALTKYFEALHSGNFVLAASLYGGPTDILQTWNPDIKDNRFVWLERACKNNGLMCLLPRTIRYHGPDSRGGYQFLVEFNLQDGSLFGQGPCCGETSGPTITRFIFSVLPAPRGWQVMELPPYVP